MLERLRDIARDGTNRRQAAISQARALRAITETAGPPDLATVLAHLPAIRLSLWRDLHYPAQLVHHATNWEIAVNADLEPAAQTHAVLHEIKHIIDLPDSRTGPVCASGESISSPCKAFITEMLGPDHVTPSGAMS